MKTDDVLTDADRVEIARRDNSFPVDPADPADPALYFDREGRPITFGTWAVLWKNKNYQIVIQTQDGGVKVSTIWLGMDHGFGAGPPLIFETMVFGGPLGELEYQRRYSTEEAAFAGHKAACNLVIAAAHKERAR